MENYEKILHHSSTTEYPASNQNEKKKVNKTKTKSCLIVHVSIWSSLWL